jgi:hypothetical protein
MKKILFFLLLLFCIPFSIFGINGNGTIGSPYNGPLTANMTWSGTVYVNGDVTVNGFTLTISPGAIIIFLATGSDIIITGTGVLTAAGTAASMIRFTADFNNNGIYGETGERWGHISFQNMGVAGPSLISNCIVEYGSKIGSGIDGYGGGIQAQFSSLTIENCIIRYNTAIIGGGIFINSSVNPVIRNCAIYSNTASGAGGGLYFYLNCSSYVTNCLIYSNLCNANPLFGVSYGGGGIYLNTGNLRFVNCVIANNTSLNVGNGIYCYNSNSTKIINSIIWGGTGNPLYFFNTSTSVINYCAVQGGSYSTCLNLNPSNSASDGPNFIATDGTNWSILLISPCRDAGTIPSPTLPTDYLGNQRIGPYDIGAYEVQYNTWKTTASSTDWNTAANWALGVPTNTQDVIIPKGATNYPTGLSSPSFTIGSGKYLIIDPGAAATFNNLSNNGILRLGSDATGIASLIMSTYIHASGTEEIQLFLPGGGSVGTYKWHYISSPVSSLATSVFTGTTPDLAQYDESRVSNNPDFGWIGSDGWIYLPLPSHYGGPVFSTLLVGHGYNHYFGSDHTYTFSGLFNTGDVINIPLAYHSGGGIEYPNVQGYNLLGNPFSSCLNWSLIAPTLNPLISQAIYFNKSGAFASWNNGVGTNGGTGTIPPMQGFFVKTSAISTSITIPANARVHNVLQNRYKKGLVIIPLVRLKVEDQLNSDDAVVRFDDNATTGVDNAFDAYKFSTSGTTIWTSSNGADLSINGLPFPQPVIEIPVTINSNSAGNLKITGSQIDGLENYDVTLTDNVNNITINLKSNPTLTFDAPGGIVNGRFVLKVLTITTAIPEIHISDKPFNIYSSTGNVNIQTLDESWNGKLGGIKVLDMTGRIVTTKDNVEFSKDNLIQIPVGASTGIYMVELRSGMMRYVGKVIIK